MFFIVSVRTTFELSPAVYEDSKSPLKRTETSSSLSECRAPSRRIFRTRTRDLPYWWSISFAPMDFCLPDALPDSKPFPQGNPQGKNSMPSTDLATVNAAGHAEFVRGVGPVFEHSPWIAGAVADRRPFGSVVELWEAMCAAVRGASEEKQTALIRAHPDLVGRAVLTAESQGEQAAAGLMELSPEEAALFARYNAQYRARFGFPFVICARLNKKDAILTAFPVRLRNDAAQERETALGEIYKIARLRLEDLIAG